MSVTTGRRLLTYIWQNNLRKSPKCTVSVRFKSSAAKEKTPSVEECGKIVIPASEPGKIHAAILKQFGSPLTIENLEVPKIVHPNEILLNVHYCGINSSDILLRSNLYKNEPSLPLVLGYEVVGQVIGLGEEAEKKGYKVGDKVVGLNKDRYNGLAEQCVVTLENTWKIPSGTKSIDAVCLLDNYMTALAALERKASITEDDMILINVGISGAGLAAIDLATNVYRAKVIGVCATEDGAGMARDKGAFAALKFKDKTLFKQLEEIAAERDIKAIFKGEDGEYFKKILCCFTDVYKEDHSIDLFRDDNFAVVVEHLSREGRVIIAGTAATKTDSEKSSEEKTGGFSITGFDLWQYKNKKQEAYRETGDEVLQLYEDGLITPTCSFTAGLYRVNEALDFACKHKSPGKVVVDIKNKEADTQEVFKD